MTLPSSPSLEQTPPAHELVLFGFSLRLHLLYRSLLRASLQPCEDTVCWTARAAGAVNDLHRDFVVLTRARLERPFAAMHGRELRRWEEHLAGIIPCRDIRDACSSDLLDEMNGIVESGEALLPSLQNGIAKEMARMLSRYRRAITRLEASRVIGGARTYFLRSAGELRRYDWDRVLTAIRCEQGGEYAAVKRGSWRCLGTALADVAETLPVISSKALPATFFTEICERPGRQSGLIRFSLTTRERVPH